MIAYEKHKGESEMAKYMIIDGIRADFDQEKNILQVINSVGIHVPPFAIIPTFPFTAPAVCVWLRTSGAI